MAGQIGTAGRLVLRPEDRERLRGRAGEAVRRARRHGEALAAITVAAAARRRPRRDRRRLAPRRRGVVQLRAGRPRPASRSPALGCVAAIDERGPDRFAAAARRWRALAERAACDDPDGPRGSGPVAVGGFAFAADGGGAPHWAGYAPASLHVPEAALARRGDDVRLTLAALARPDDAPEEVVARLERRAGRAARAPAAAARPRPRRALPRRQRDAARALRGRGRPRGRAHPRRARSTRSCSRARSRSTRRAPHDARRACSASCARRSPRATSSARRAATARSSPRARSCSSAARGCAPGTLALAGSTRRSADPAVDDHLGEQLLRSAKDREEQAIVSRRIVRALRPHSVWVTAAEEPVVVKMANIQHLATPIRAQLAQPVERGRARRPAAPDARPSAASRSPPPRR